MYRTRTLWIAKRAVPVLAVLMAAAYLTLSYFVAFGVTRAERNEQDGHPTDYGLEYEDVEFQSRKGDVTLQGWHLPATDDGPSVIFVHGISSTRSGDEAVEIAAHLVNDGFDVLLFDLRAHGSSGGDKITGGINEAEDVLGAYDYLLSRGASPVRIGVLGMSMGAGTSVLAVAEEPGIRGLVVDSPYADVSELVAYEIGRKTPIPEWVAPVFVPGASLFADMLFGVDLDKLVPEEAVESIGFPILVIHGDSDTRIPTEHGLRVHEAAYLGSEIWVVPGVDHLDAFKTFPDDYLDRVVPYFRARLDGE